MGNNWRSSRQASTKETRLVERAARAVNGRVEYTADGHLRVYGPLGVTTIGSKLNERRTWLNSLASLRAIGVDPRPRPGRTSPKAES